MDSVLEVVDHAFVEIQLHRHSSNVDGLVQPDEPAEQGLLQASLDERRWKPSGIVAIDGALVRSLANLKNPPVLLHPRPDSWFVHSKTWIFDDEIKELRKPVGGVDCFEEMK